MASGDDEGGLQAVVKLLDDIPEAEVNRSTLEQVRGEDAFTGTAVELLIEAGCLATVATSIFPQGREAWSRDQAIVGGHMVRLTKLIDSVLDQTCKRRRETMMVLTRMTMETIINLIYLSKNASDDLFASYIQYSFRHEKRLFDLIHSRIKDRNGQVLPIEQRMLASVEKKARASGVSIEATSSSRPKNWGDKNLFQRAQAIGFDDAYLGVISGPSHNIHGNWMDLLEYHLESHDEHFVPKPEWSRPRPQILLAVSRLTLDAIAAYLDFIGHIGARQVMHPRLERLCKRIRETDRLHESYLSKREDTSELNHGTTKEPAIESS